MSGAHWQTKDETAGDAGFALAEALLAFAILSLITLAMMRAFSGTTLAWGASAAHEARLDIAARLMEEARAADPAIPGRREGAEGRWVWWTELAQVSSAGLPPPPGAARLFRFSVGVGPKGERHAPPPLLSTLILARDGDGS